MARFTPLFGRAGLRLAAPLVLLALFLLPFHRHAQADTPRFTNECSCVLSARQELVQAQSFSLTLPKAWTTLVEAIAVEVVSNLFSFDHSGRAPPLR